MSTATVEAVADATGAPAPAAEPVAASPAPSPAAKVETTVTTEPAKSAAPVVPDTYTLTLPENSTLDASAIERTAAIARALGLPNDAAAQKVLDLVNQEATTRAEKVRDEVLADHQPGGAGWSKLLDGWKAETLADQTLGKTPEERTAAVQRGAQVIDKFAKANPEMGATFKQFLNTSGLGEKREVVHFFKWLGEVAGEKPAVMPSGAPNLSGPGAAVAQKYIDAGMNP